MTLDDLSGKSLYSLMDEDQRKGHEEVVRRLTPSSPHVDGNDLWLAGRLIHWRKSGIFDNRGRLIEVQAIGRDITHEREMIERLKVDAVKVINKTIQKTDDMISHAVASLNRTMDKGRKDG